MRFGWPDGTSPGADEQVRSIRGTGVGAHRSFSDWHLSNPVVALGWTMSPADGLQFEATAASDGDLTVGAFSASWLTLDTPELDVAPTASALLADHRGRTEYGLALSLRTRVMLGRRAYLFGGDGLLALDRTGWQLQLNVGAGYQLTDWLAIQLGTTLLRTGSRGTRLLFADDAPLSVAAVFTLGPRLDLGLRVTTDLLRPRNVVGSASLTVRF